MGLTTNGHNTFLDEELAELCFVTRQRYHLYTACVRIFSQIYYYFWTGMLSIRFTS